MSKPVKIRIVKADGVARDTTVGKVYDGVFYETGERITISQFPVLALEDTVVFYDDVGDEVENWVSEGNYEILPE